MAAREKQIAFALAACGVAAALVLFAGADALAQQPPRNPFNVGVAEGAGRATGITGWILQKQNEFDLALRGAVRAVRTSDAALWTLLTMSFAYGVFHAAGPGHGKAVVSAYMIANERALRRGVTISFAAAALQALVAIAIVGVMAFAFSATSRAMQDAARFIEIASFAGIALLGAWLVWKKGRALMALVRAPAPAGVLATAGGPSSRFICEAVETDPGHVHDENCAHFHMPDPRTLGDNFSWKETAATVFPAGARPCSGAIIVLVFALAQSILYAGVLATFAMALGTAITTSALATLAVFAKRIALKLSGEGSRRGALAARGLEFAAACLVMFLGVALTLGYSMAGG